MSRPATRPQPGAAVASSTARPSRVAPAGRLGWGRRPRPEETRPCPAPPAVPHDATPRRPLPDRPDRRRRTRPPSADRVRGRPAARRAVAAVGGGRRRAAGRARRGFGAARRGRRHRVVLVGADLADAVAAAGLPRRPEVALVSTGPRRRRRCGSARSRSAPPRSSCSPTARTGWSTLLADACARGPRWRRGRRRRRAGRCGREHAERGDRAGRHAAGLRAVLVDGDPLGGGIDLVLGGEDVPGVRWPDLAGARGRVPPADLAAALPEVDALHVLSWDRSDVLDVGADGDGVGPARGRAGGRPRRRGPAAPSGRVRPGGAAACPRRRSWWCRPRCGR